MLVAILISLSCSLFPAFRQCQTPVPYLHSAAHTKIASSLYTSGPHIMQLSRRFQNRQLPGVNLAQVWQQYKWHAAGITAVIALVILEGLLIGKLLVEQSRRKRASDAMRAAVKVFETTGEVFFRSLTEHLNSILQVDYVSIGELSESGRSIKTVAVSADGKNLENMEYDLEHTPCEKVLAHGRYFDRSNVQARFPQD